MYYYLFSKISGRQPKCCNSGCNCRECVLTDFSFLFFFSGRLSPLFILALLAVFFLLLLSLLLFHVYIYTTAAAAVVSRSFHQRIPLARYIYVHNSESINWTLQLMLFLHILFSRLLYLCVRDDGVHSVEKQNKRQTMGHAAAAL